jgi:hypothetical protein
MSWLMRTPMAGVCPELFKRISVVMLALPVVVEREFIEVYGVDS